jgi:hypothetical protein
LEPGAPAYRAANEAILDRVGKLAVDGHEAVSLIVAREGEGEMVEHLLNRTRLRGTATLRIDPTVDLTSRPRCFVAMPFGRKTDPQRRIEVDCNEVYAKVLVPALENAQLNYRRADEEIDSGIVLEPMIEWIASADLVIGDLSTGNFNVGWELGLRHVLRLGETLLIGPAGTTAPFDLAALRHVAYRQDETGISDAEVIQAWKALEPYLARAGAAVDSDSPVAAVMEVRQWAEVRRRTAHDDRWESLRDSLSLARDLGDPTLMQELVSQAEGVSDDHLRLLRGEAGVGLVRLGAFDAARPLLEEVVRADPQVQRPDAHAFYAQALYRPKNASRDDLAEAERVLKVLLTRRPGHPEVRALLGAVLKRRLLHADSRDARLADLRAALGYYRHDLEHDLNRYYEGVNVVGLGTVLALTDGDDAAGALARELIPAVRVAARFAADRPAERYWALASIAECALHEHYLQGHSDSASVRTPYYKAGAEHPPDGDRRSTLDQLDFLAALGLPQGPLIQAREGLQEGTEQLR